MRQLLPGLLLLCCLGPAAAQAPLTTEPPFSSLPATTDAAAAPPQDKETGGLPVVGMDSPPACPPGPTGRIEVDYLYWFLRPLRVPALLTTGPAGSSGVIGDPGTAVVYGDDRLRSRHDNVYAGVQLRGDWWLDDAQQVGLNGSAFFLERDSSNMTVNYHTLTPLARPFTAADGSQQSLIVAGVVPGLGELSGGFNAYSRIELFGQDLNAVLALIQKDEFRLNALLGGRFLQMRERLDLTGTSRLLPVENVLFGVTDHIDTFDKFFGAQAGLLGAWRWGAFSVEGKATVALGADAQEIKTKGDRLYQTPFERVTQPYGLYVLPSNSGSFQRADFDVVTEVDLTLGWELTRWLRLRGGYGLMTWNNPVRPGDQIQPVNLTQLVPAGLTGTPGPGVPFKKDFFWAHGGHVGLELCW